MQIKAPRGTSDWLPNQSEKISYLIKLAQSLFENYGYRYIITPLFEQTELFIRAIGESSDIVQKEMYTFKDKGGRSLTLRPEGTAPIARAFIEHGLSRKESLTKLHYFGSFFRHERPQAGRFREFQQVGVEAMGSEDPYLDIEIISLMMEYYKKLGLEQIELHLNSVGCRKCQPHYKEELKRYLKKDEEKLCLDCQRRFEVNTLRIFDCKVSQCQNIAKEAPKPVDFLCPDCQKHFKEIRAGLSLLNLKYQLDPLIVRGIDYYSRTIFEARSPLLGAQNALGGGGRYDFLIEEYGGPPTPAIGFAVGVERTILAMEKEGVDFPLRGELKAYLVILDKKFQREAFLILDSLRREGISADMDYTGKSLKSQMKQADRKGVDFALIIGEEEAKNKFITVRRMRDGQQIKISREKLAQYLKKATER